MEGIFGVEGRKAQAFMQGFMQVPVGLEVCMIPHVCARTGEWLCALCVPQNNMCSGHIRGYLGYQKILLISVFLLTKLMQRRGEELESIFK